jgi:hypothetical protein
MREQRASGNGDAETLPGGEMMLAREHVALRVVLKNHMTSPAQATLVAAGVERIPRDRKDLCQRPPEAVDLDAAYSVARLDLDSRLVFHIRTMPAPWRPGGPGTFRSSLR